jgi:phage baseplate assembly protein V
MSDLATSVWRALQRMVGRGRVSLVDDRGPVQLLQLTSLGLGDVKDGVPRLAEYGFTSMPPQDTDAIVLFLSGERSNGVVIATSHQSYRLKSLQDGDVALYDSRGNFVKLSGAGLTLHAQAGDIKLEAPAGIVDIVALDVKSNGVSISELHEHSGGTISGHTGMVIP